MRATLDELDAKAAAAKEAARLLAKLPSTVKDQALTNIAEGLRAEQEQILAANERDIEAGRRAGLSESLIDRLLLDPERLGGIARDVMQVVALPDPVGETFDSRTLPSGLQVGRRRVPLGVIGAIYESRPNITVDFAALCVKSGNAVILRGGKEAVHSNAALASMIEREIVRAGVPAGAVQFIESTDRALVGRMLAMKGLIDLIVPRGGQDLIRRVAEESDVPAVTGGVGVCHTYVDRAADIDMAVSVVHNAKVQRPSVCNAMDTMIVHSAVASAYLSRIAELWTEVGVEMRCDLRAASLLGQRDGLAVVPAVEDDWGTEFLSLTAGVKVVDSIDEAIEHIESYGSGHSEAIITEDYSAAMRFVEEVDASAVMVNASTRFNDGGQFGLGAEVAISTNKLHARGPMGLRELTSYKWVVLGSGQIRT